MKLTTKGRYAVMAMADLASYSKDKPVSLTAIAKRQNISLAYLEQLFIHLKEDKLVKSVRGVKGGYALERPASEIRLSNIFHAVNEDEQNDTLIWLSKNIKRFLFVENRISVKSDNFSLPKDHFRRIEHQEKLIDGIKSYGFKLEYKKISTKFSKYKSSYNVSDIKSDPLLIRLIFSKK